VSDVPLRTIRLLVEFDGTHFHGWQQQLNARSVQLVLRQALHKMLGHDPIQLRASSRTDAGVHAVALPVSFRTASTIPTFGFLRGLNTILPADVSIADVRVMGDGFNPRRASKGKRYRYDIWDAPCRSALRSRRSWWVKGRPLDIEAMRIGAHYLVGEHDFTSFRAVDCDSKTTRRKLNRVDVDTEDPYLVRITVDGDAFLKHMVRVIVGTLVDVGRGRTTPDGIAEILAARDRRAAGQTAPPQGLTLMQVFYD